MATYRCTGCGLGECNVGVSTDEMDPVQFMSRFKCTVWSDVCTDLELDDAEGSSMEPGARLREEHRTPLHEQHREGGEREKR